MTVKADIYQALALRHFRFIGIENPGSAPTTFAEGSVPSLVAGLPALSFSFRSPASAAAMAKPVSMALLQDVLAAVAAQEGLNIAP